MISITQERLSNVFTQNRTEELGADVWQHFVVPPFYDRLDLQTARKPRVIIGGRGCGKTMLLRYLSYRSAFSTSRPHVPPETVNHIGLYWRADTQFARIMLGRGLSIETWGSAFDHLLALTVSADVLDSLSAIWNSGAYRADGVLLEDISFPGLEMFDAGFAGKIGEVRQTIERRLRQFELWASNIGKTEEPIFLPGRRFVAAVIEECKRNFAVPNNAIFFVYVDEYENLLEYQQRIINTSLKHSEIPLIFNIAMKRRGFSTQQTVGEESIVDVADFRTHDIEGYLEQGFDLFAAEVLLLTLRIAGWDVPIDISALRDPSKLTLRRDAEYRDRVISFITRLFPGLSHEQLAQRVFDDDVMLGKLRRSIEKALKARGEALPPENFIRRLVPQASIVTSALLYRPSLKPLEILHELDNLEAGHENRFTGTTDWTHNNFVGCLLALYDSSSRVCPFYAGFDSFTVMARGNLRHFLELCHQSLSGISSPAEDGIVSVAPDRQAAAARYTSNAFLGQVRSFGRLGNRLHTFILRLGSLFALAHQRPTQSEPEQSHFSVTHGTTALAEDDLAFLNEAVKWSVLFETEETKVKDPLKVSNLEYVLNPIYASYFNITFRKRRKLELSVEEFLVLEKGSYDQVNALLKQFSNSWKVNLPDASPTLFSHLIEE